MSETSKQRQQPPPRPARGSLWCWRRALRPSRTGLWSTRATKPLHGVRPATAVPHEHRTLPGHTTPREAPSVGESERRIGTASGGGDKPGPISPPRPGDRAELEAAGQHVGRDRGRNPQQPGRDPAGGSAAARSGRQGIGEGPFARESIPARGPERNFTDGERREINRIGSLFGCHTCGTTEPGTKTGNVILDHQTPTALRLPGSIQRLYPQCLSCNHAQGGYVRSLGRMR
jgi:hypothetical protein